MKKKSSINSLSAVLLLAVILIFVVLTYEKVRMQAIVPPPVSADFSTPLIWLGDAVPDTALPPQSGT